MIDPNYQGEIGWLLHNESKEDYFWNTGYPLGYLLVLLCAEIKIDGKLQQPNPVRASNGPETKVWITTLSKEPQLAMVLAEGKKYTERVVEDSYKYQLGYWNTNWIKTTLLKFCHFQIKNK